MTKFVWFERCFISCVKILKFSNATDVLVLAIFFSYHDNEFKCFVQRRHTKCMNVCSQILLRNLENSDILFWKNSILMPYAVFLQNFQAASTTFWIFHGTCWRNLNYFANFFYRILHLSKLLLNVSDSAQTCKNKRLSKQWRTVVVM